MQVLSISPWPRKALGNRRRSLKEEAAACLELQKASKGSAPSSSAAIGTSGNSGSSFPVCLGVRACMRACVRVCVCARACACTTTF